MPRPIWVYDNWGAYTDGEGGYDDTRLTEEFALARLRDAIRLTESGVRFDYHMMNAFWFEPAGGYRVWRRADWPQGPDRWIAECRDNGIRPGLWFGTNAMWKTEIIPEWEDSTALSGDEPWSFGLLSLSRGGFLAHLVETMQDYYDRGVRMFEFDVADFGARTAADAESSTPEDARERNVAAFTDALREFRARNPEARFAAFNGFGGDFATEHDTTSGPDAFVATVDPRFAEVFDSLYTGDTSVSDVPMRSFFRSVDLYNDHKARKYEANGIPLEQADGFFVMATTWFGYHRRTDSWRSSLVHLAARGSGKKTVYGDVGLLSDEDALWFARVQAIYDDVLDAGTTTSFGAMPGRAEPYGFVSADDAGALWFVVNPSQEVREIALPALGAAATGRVLFTDPGFVPTLADGVVTLGPEQIALIGTGRFDSADHDLGLETDVLIPRASSPVDATVTATGSNAVEATFDAPEGGIRIICQAFGDGGLPRKTIEYQPEGAERAGIDAALRGRAFTVEATVNGEPVPVGRSEAWAQFMGTSWAVVELPAGAVAPGDVVTVRCATRAPDPVTLRVAVRAVIY